MTFQFRLPAKQMVIFCNDDNYPAPKGLKTHSLAYFLLTYDELTPEKKDYLSIIWCLVEETENQGGWLA